MVETVLLLIFCMLLGGVPVLLAWKLARRPLAIAASMAWLALTFLVFFAVSPDPHPYIQVLMVPVWLGWLCGMFFAWFSSRLRTRHRQGNL